MTYIDIERPDPEIFCPVVTEPCPTCGDQIGCDPFCPTCEAYRLEASE